MEAVLDLRGVEKQYPGHRAVGNISLQVPRGAFFSLLGPSGCGKTTTLRIVAGFETPTAGEVWLNGERIDHLPPYRRNVNTVFQSYALFPHLSVRGNIEFGLRRRHSNGTQNGFAEKVRHVLQQVRLDGKEARLPSQLSGGERQRVALARALVLAPDVLLLDEPLSALDPLLRKQVRAELKDLQRRTGVTFLFVTHDQEEALSLSDQMAVMNAGEIEQIGSPQELYQRPRTRFVASFLGAMNWIQDAGVRPEATRIFPDMLQTPNGTGRHGVVTGATFLGSFWHIDVKLDDGSSVISQTPAQNAGAAAFSPGDRVRVSWADDDLLRFVS